MTKRKYKSYTLWLKWRGGDWQPIFTVTENHWFGNPYTVIVGHMARFGSFWERGVNWIIKPEGQVPAGKLNNV